LAQYDKNALLKESTDKLWEVADETSRAAERVLANVPVDKLSHRDMTVLLMCCNCLSDLVAGIQSLMLGMHRPSGTIFRACTENVALAIAIELREEVFTKYRDGKFRTPDAIGIAKEVIPQIGKVWGVLSEKFVHEPHETIGRAIRQTDSTLEFMLIPPIDGTGLVPQLLLLNQAAMCSIMIGEVIEWAFAEYLREMTYWNHVEGEQLVTKGTKGKEIAFQLSKELKAVLDKRQE
jgi:hypothetical protein